MLGLALLEKEDYTGAISELGKVSLSLSPLFLLPSSLSLALFHPDTSLQCVLVQKKPKIKGPKMFDFYCPYCPYSFFLF